MTIEMEERVDEAVKEGLRLVQQCHLWLTRASWERGKGHQDTRSGIRSNRILIRLHHQKEQVQNSSLEKGLAVAAQKQLPLCSQSVCPPTGAHEETIIRTFG